MKDTRAEIHYPSKLNHFTFRGTLPPTTLVESSYSIIVSFVNYSRISKNNLSKSIFLFFISLNFDKVLFLLSNFLFEAIDRFFSIILYYYISSSKLSSQNRNITFSNEISHFFLFFFSFNPPTNKCSYIYFTLSPFHPRLSPLLSATATYYTSA